MIPLCACCIICTARSTAAVRLLFVSPSTSFEHYCCTDVLLVDEGLEIYLETAAVYVRIAALQQYLPASNDRDPSIIGV